MLHFDSVFKYFIKVLFFIFYLFRVYVCLFLNLYYIFQIFVYNIHFLKLFKINFELNGTLKIATITIIALKDIRASSKAAIVN
jgi:hypothetical protein